MNSPFRVCITRADGEAVHLHPNSQGERDFINDIVTRVTKKVVARHLDEDIVNRTIAKGVGVLRTEAHVRTDMQAAVSEVNPVLAFQHDLITSLAEAVMALKSEVVPS